MIVVFVILAITIGLFISDRMRLDLVALLSLLALTITGVLSASEALAGFLELVGHHDCGLVCRRRRAV